MDIILDSLYSIASDILYGFNRTCFVHLLSLLEGLGTFVMIGVMWFLIHAKVEIINYLRFHSGARVWLYRELIWRKIRRATRHPKILMISTCKVTNNPITLLFNVNTQYLPLQHVSLSWPHTTAYATNKRRALKQIMRKLQRAPANNAGNFSPHLRSPHVSAG